MKKRRLAMALLLAALPLGAGDGLCGCGSIEVGGEALYWKPNNGGFEFAQTGHDEAAFCLTRHQIEPQYHWGFQIGGRYTADDRCAFVQLSGLYIKADDSLKVKGVDLEPAFPQSGQSSETLAIRGDLDQRYWNLDLRLGRFLHRNCCGVDFAPFVGVRYVDLCRREQIHVAGLQSFTTPPAAFATRDDFCHRMELEAVGPEVGIDTSICVGCGFRLNGSAAVLAVVGDRKTSYRETFVNAVADEPVEFVKGTSKVLFRSPCVIAPGVDLRITGSWEKAWCSVIGRVWLGYQLHHYWNVFHGVQPFGVFFPREIRDAGFGGMVLGASLGY